MRRGDDTSRRIGIRRKPRPGQRSGPPAVVIGLDGPTGLQTARILSTHGIGVVGLAEDPDHPCARTRSCEHVLESSIAGPDLVETLLTRVTGLVGGEAVLVPCSDLSVVTLARWRKVLREKGFRFVLPDHRTVETLLNKDSFSRFVREHGFPAPETHVIDDPAMLPEIEPALTFPCILKPSVKTPAWEREAPGKAIRIDTPDELRRACAELFRLAPAFVIQEWIEGNDEAHFSCNCYFDRDGCPRLTFTTRKVRQWPPKVGQGCLSVECENDTVRDLTLELFARARHRGLGYLEVKQDQRTGRHVILEANVGRPTGRSATADASGVHLLRTHYQDALERPLPAARPQEFRGMKWIHVRRDLQASVRLWRLGELGLREWWRSLRGKKTHALFSWTDPLPFVADGIRAARKWVTTFGRGEDRTEFGSDPDRTVGRPGKRFTRKGQPRSDVVDYDIRGDLGIRLVDPAAADVRSAEAVLGRPGSTLRREPDLVIRFVEDPPTVIRGVDEPPRSTSTRECHVPLRDPSKDAVAWIHLEDDGRLREVLVQKNGGPVPFLQELVDVSALARGWIPLHASAWIHHGRGILAVGLDRSGKTGALLASAGRGASIVGDDRIFLRSDGERMIGVARPLRIKPWHMAQLPWLAERVDRRTRVKAGASLLLRRIETRIAGNGGAGGTGKQFLRKALGRVHRSLSVDRFPDHLFEDARCPGLGSPDVILALVSDGEPDVRVETLEPDSLVPRMAAAVAIELLPLVRAYRASQFSHPTHRWTALEGAEQLARDLLETSLGEGPAILVRHPYPGSLRDLRTRIESITADAAIAANPGTTRSGSRVSTPALEGKSSGRLPSECPTR